MEGWPFEEVEIRMYFALLDIGGLLTSLISLRMSAAGRGVFRVPYSYFDMVAR